MSCSQPAAEVPDLALPDLAMAVSPTPIHRIVVDGKFDDWKTVQSYVDPVGNTHDTDHSQMNDLPVHIEHPDVDLVEYKFTHDEQNLYAYFRAVGAIGRTQTAVAGKAGRYYVIVTIDVDNDENTGYWLHEGGYYPTTRGYDLNMEVEFFDGHLNKGNYLNHGCLNQMELDAAFLDQAQGVVDVKAGTYKFYSEWVMFNAPAGRPLEKVLPDGSSIVFVQDKSPAYEGIMNLALSPDGHEAEVSAPFRGFMKDRQGRPVVALGKTLNVSFSLEASGELAPGMDWASNTAEPIRGYRLSP